MEQIKRPSRGITPELIVSKLFNFHNKAHFLHLNADTIGKHILLDALYKDLVEHKDSIAEFLLGVQAPKRLGTFTLESVESLVCLNSLVSLLYS